MLKERINWTKVIRNRWPHSINKFFWKYHSVNIHTWHNIIYIISVEGKSENERLTYWATKELLKEFKELDSNSDGLLQPNEIDISLNLDDTDLETLHGA